MSSELVVPVDYPQVLAQIKGQVRSAHQRAMIRANAGLIELYWTIGQTVLERQSQAGWGSKIIDRLSADLRAEFPGVKGLGRSNLHSMRAVAAAYPEGPETIVQTASGQISWSHVVTLVEKLDEPQLRDWYAAATVHNGWTQRVLLNQIKNKTHLRVGAAPSNFLTTLPEGHGALAQEITKDPYVLEFLDLTGEVSERELEDALVDKLQATLGEFGRGFAFVGRQVPVTTGSRDRHIDLLFFHYHRLAFIVVELKIGAFDPRDAGQLGFYVTWVDDNMRLPEHNPTLGILMCADTDDADTVHYALRASSQPMAVASYTLDSSYTADELPAPVGEEQEVLVDMVTLLERVQGRHLAHPDKE